MVDFNALVSELPANGVIALMLVPFLQWAKNHESPMLAWVNSRSVPFISAVLAAIGAVGINWNYDPGAHQLVITVPTFAAGLQGGIEWAKQYSANHWGHRLYTFFRAVGSAVEDATSAKSIPVVTLTTIKEQ